MERNESDLKAAQKLSEFINEELKRQGITMNQFYRNNAKLCSFQTIENMVKGKKLTNYGFVVAILDALGYEITFTPKHKEEDETEN